MDLEIVYLKPEELTPYEGNTRKHAPEDVEQIKESIKADGFNDPIGIWGERNLIVEGHGRRIAAMELGLERVPCIRLDHLTDTQRRDYAIRHNFTSDQSEFDFGKLREEVAALEIEGLDMSYLDSLGEELQGALGESVDDYQITEDEPPEPPEEPTAKRGQIWQLGRHRLMCGDSTSTEDIAQLMGAEKARMLFTSPPYSDMREYEGGKDLSVENLSNFISAYRPYTDYQCVNLGIQRKENEIIQYWDGYIQAAKRCGYKFMAWNVWNKMDCGSIGQHNAFIPICHEWIFVFGTEYFDINETWEKKEENIREHTTKCTQRQADGTTTRRTHGDMSGKYKKMESVLSLLPEKHNDVRQLHPATFPIGLPAEYIKAMTDKDDIVIEPFGGSGTTLIACEELNRQCRIMELEPKYCDVIIQRFENFTGLKAVLLNG